jgi:hypothetical protein
VIDRREQSELLGLSEIGHEAQVTLEEIRRTENGVVASARATPYWATGHRPTIPIHRRVVHIANDGVIDIRDSVEGAGVHHVAWFFHFGPGIAVSQISDGTWEIEDEGGICLGLLETNVAAAVGARVASGELNPMLGWGSTSSASIFPLCVLVYEGMVTLPVECRFKFMLHAAEQASEGRVQP